jgi:hypothetical protein
MTSTSERVGSNHVEKHKNTRMTFPNKMRVEEYSQSNCLTALAQVRYLHAFIRPYLLCEVFCFINEHDGYALSYGIGQFTGITDQSVSLHPNVSLALRTGQDLKQFIVNHRAYSA